MTVQQELKCEPFSFFEYSWLTMRTAVLNAGDFFGIKYKTILLALLIVVLGGAWSRPEIVTLLFKNPASVLLAMAGVVILMLLRSAHKMHIDDHARWGVTLTQLRDTIDGMKAEMDKSSATPADVTLVSQLMNHFAHTGRDLANSLDRSAYPLWLSSCRSMVETAIAQNVIVDFVNQCETTQSCEDPDTRRIFMLVQWLEMYASSLEAVSKPFLQ